MEEIIFTPSAVLGLISEIEELKGQDISFQEDGGKIDLVIGSNKYEIDTTVAEELQVDDYSIETISNANEAGYEDLADNSNVEFMDAEPVEGGIIKELLKTLAIGGLVRLTNNAIRKS